MHCGQPWCTEFLSVVRSIHPGWAVVRLFWDVLFEFFEGLCDVSIHADTYGAFGVVPFEVHPDVLFSFTINFKWVFGTDTGNEVMNVLFVRIFDTKVVDDKGEGNVSCVTEKESFSAWCLVVAEFF